MPEMRPSIDIRGEFTDLVLTHEDLPDALAAERHEVGWGSIIDKLASRLGGES